MTGFNRFEIIERVMGIRGSNADRRAVTKPVASG